MDMISELAEQARLLGAGASREARLMAQNAELQRRLYQCETENRNVHKENLRLGRKVRGKGQ